MIRAITLQNVRIFSDTPRRFDLASLSIFCGTNSAGKSTVLKTILLLCQASKSRFPGSLPFTGPHVDLGDFSSFVSENDTSRFIQIGLDCDVPLTKGRLAFLESLKNESSDHQDVDDDDQTGEVCILRSEFFFGAVESPATSLTRSDGALNRSEVGGQTARLARAAFSLLRSGRELLIWEVVRHQHKIEEFEEETVYRLFLPLRYFERVGGTRLMKVDQEEDRVAVFCILDGILPKALLARTPDVSDGQTSPTEGDDWDWWPMPPHIQSIQRQLETLLEQIHYLGPLRSPAKRYYLTVAGDLPDLDQSGDFLPYVLRDKATTEVVTTPLNSDRIVTMELATALDFWLSHMRTGNAAESSGKELTVQTTARVLVQIALRSASGIGEYALADSGFGYSQLLPILMRSLLAPAGATIIIEQPELHLNPALQVRLVDFFVSIIRTGKQLVIETHSEHIVNALRVLAAEDRETSLASQMRLYFLSAETSGLEVIDMSIQPDGTIPNWPRAFFGEALSLASRLLRAQRQVGSAEKH